MKRLITFGCSYTHGVELNGTTMWDPPSKLAWPEELAQKTNRVAINLAVPGASNLEILWKLLNFEFQETDLCVIAWSHFSRECVFEDNNTYQLDFHQPTALEKNWTKAHTEHDHTVRNWLHIHHANQHLTATKIADFYHAFAGDPGDFNKVPRELPLNNVLRFDFDSVDFGTDHSHPGIASHKLFSDKIYEEIKKKESYELR